ncbi:hypothetical protein R84B8_02911 [Treponema sp. R8-4-B8]
MKNFLYKILLILILTLPVSLSAYDFGLVINADGGLGNTISEDNLFDFEVNILPRFSTLIGDNGDLIISAGFSVGNDGEPFYIPELLRTEFSMRFGDSSLRVGRVNFSDPLAFIANGLFDGIQYQYNSGFGSFRVGAWYTGLQYKKRANIAMTDAELIEVSTPVVYDDFFNTYFASKRVISSIGWEHPSIGEVMHLNAAFVGQTDLNDAVSKYHSQYIILKAGMPISNFLLEIGGSVEFAQAATDELKFNVAFAGEIGLFLLFPSKFNTRLSFTSVITSGRTDSTIAEFIPIAGKEYGYILKTRIPGLSIFSLNYSSKFSDSLSGLFTVSYFVRGDWGTFNSYPVSTDSKGYFLGPEVSAMITWSPASDLQFNLGGGAFFPALGDAGAEEKIKWRVDLTVIMSIL